MKHRLLLSAAVLAAGMLLLTACTASPLGGSAPGGSGTSSGSGGSSGGTQDPGTVQQPDAGGDVQGQPDDGGEGVQPDGGSGAGTQPDAGGDAQAQPGDTEQNASPDDAAGEDGSQAPADASDAAGGSGAAEDYWSGVYVGEQETVTISLTDAENISFSFAESGISGTASVNGYQAVFRGDDYHVVVFNVDGGLLNVSVSSEEDYDTSSSPLNGTYTKQ